MNAIVPVTPLDSAPTFNKPFTYILHHGDCDGYAAGAIAYNSLSDSSRTFRTIPVQYGQPFPLTCFTPEDEIFILDFSYKRHILDDVYSKVGKLVVLDHHLTAEEELRDAPYAHFDMTKSGVLLAWEYFVPEYPASEAVMWLNAYDLWQKNNRQYPWTQVVMFHMACDVYLKDFSFWTSLMNGYHIDPKLWQQGEELYHRFAMSVEEVKASPLTEVRVIHGKRFGFFFAQSEISLLCDAMYSDKALTLDAVVCCTGPKEGKWSVSLRAPADTPLCVHEIAKSQGGGGHRKAAGFKLETDIEAVDLVDVLVTKLTACTF